jgi:16S rRNA (uracil1498-N3)-methyltransferase
MRQFELPPDYTGQKRIVLSGKDHHYLSRVLRFKPGDGFTGCDRTGALYRIVIRRMGRRDVELEVTKTETHLSPPYTLSLYQCLPKGRVMDRIVRQATEAGVGKIVPLFSDYTVPKRSDNFDTKLSRWNRVAERAVEQSGTRRPPVIGSPASIFELSEDRTECNLFFHPQPGGNLHRYLERGPAKINILLGPEGGFSEREVAFLRSKGFQPVFLGDTILRVETAAIFAVAVVKLLMLELDTWKSR